jgi:tetratricopeptide (TPR) repeat protein
MAVTLPVVLLMLDWYPFNRIESFKTFRSALVEKLPFVALSIVSSILTILAQRAGGALSSIDILPLSTRLPVAAASLFAYLGKMLWPLNLVPYYPYPKDVSILSLEYLAPIALVIGLTAGCIVMVKKHKIWLSAWGYYVVTLLPVLGIVQVGGQSMADRYTYLPGLGPFFIMGLAAVWIADKVNALKKWSLVIKVFSAAAAIFILVFLSYLTFKQISIWKNSIELWSYVIEKDPERICIAYNSRGVAFDKIGQFDRALEDYDKAIVLNSSYPEAYNNRGITFKKIGMFNKAIENFDKAIALNPAYYKAYNNRASAFGKIGQPDKALEDYERAIALNPSFYEAYLNRGILYGQVRLLDKAIESFNQSIAINPEYAEAYYNRGFAYSLIGQDDRALYDFTKAIELNQNFAVAYLNRGKLYFKAGQREQAMADFRKACDLGIKEGCNALY